VDDATAIRIKFVIHKVNVGHEVTNQVPVGPIKPRVDDHNRDLIGPSTGLAVNLTEQRIIPQLIQLNQVMCGIGAEHQSGLVTLDRQSLRRSPATTRTKTWLPCSVANRFDKQTGTERTAQALEQTGDWQGHRTAFKNWEIRTESD
jgi:hypothetical protein